VIFPSNLSLLVVNHPHFWGKIFDGKTKGLKSGARQPEKRGERHGMIAIGQLGE
jgi:hypothetical protein